MPRPSFNYSTALGVIWDRSGYDRGYITNPFSGPAGPEIGLLRTRALLDTLGSPDRTYPIVHVAGSKGKGSTSAFAATIGQEAGYRTGLFTSPHLHSLRERIELGGEPVDEATFAALTETVAKAASELEAAQPELGQVTAFELVTAMALLAFAQQSCKLAVVEVGLGGTYDATNVIEPTVSVITRLDLEHTQVLGDTMAEIAWNKAGIIKSSRPVVTPPQDPEGIAVIVSRAAELGAPLRIGGEDFKWQGSWRDFRWNDLQRTIADLRTGMAGDHQMENAALAIAAWQELGSVGLSADDAAIKRGVRWASLPGRFERVVQGDRIWVLDGAHTPVAAHALAHELLAEFGQPVTVIAGFLRDKQPGMFLEALAPAMSQLIVTAPRNPRALPVDDLVLIARSVDPQAILSPNMETSFQRAYELTGAEMPIVVTGSLTLVAEARVQLGLGFPDPSPNLPESSAHLRSIPIR